MNQQNPGSNRSASPAAGKVATKSHEAAEQLKDAAVGQVNQVRERAYSARSQASGRIQGVATHLREWSDTLREEDEFLSSMTGRASRGIEDVAQYVGAVTPQRLVRDTERIARRQPALFYGATFMLGLALGRFMKGASDIRWEPRDDGSNDLTPDETAGARGYTASGERQDRTSGFYSSGSERATGSNQRPGANHDAPLERGVPRPGRPASVEAGKPTGTSVSTPATDAAARARGANGEKGTPA